MEEAAVETPEGAAVAEEARAPGVEEEAVAAEAAPGAPQMAALTKQIQAQVDRLSPADKKALKQEIQYAREGIPAGSTKQAAEAIRAQRKPTRQKSFQELLMTPRPTAADKARAEQLAFKREKLAFEKQKTIDAATKDFFSKTMAEAKDAKQNDMRLKRMEELNKGGKLNSPGFVSALNTLEHGLWGVGLNLKWLMNPDSQEFEKLSNDFLKNAKSIFGARVTQGEIEMFLKTIPSLTQTTKGRERVIRNMKLFNQGAKLKKDAMAEIIEMNGGERPKNIELLVEKKIAPKLDQLSKKFAGAKKPKPPEKSMLGKIFGPIEDLRKWLNPSSRY